MGELRIRKLILPSFGIAAVFACMLAALGCGGGGPDGPLSAASAPLPTPPARSKPSEPRPLINGQPDPEALAKRFLEYLSANDAKAIQSLRLTKREFCEYVWPELSSSQIPNVTCDWTWEQATLKSDGGLSELLPRHAGKRYELALVRFAGGTEDHYTYRIHKDTRMVLVDENGERTEVGILGSMLELDGKYKLFSFREE